jgi:hypothetical protein
MAGSSPRWRVRASARHLSSGPDEFYELDELNLLTILPKSRPFAPLLDFLEQAGCCLLNSKKVRIKSAFYRSNRFLLGDYY